MKKTLQTIVSILFVSTFFLFSCKKKNSDPTPDNAPKLKTGTTTTFSIDEGRNGSWVLTNDVEDPQGDSWVVSSVTSSNSSVLLAGTGNKDNQTAFYEGVAPGTATITIVLTDSTGAARTITGTVTVVGVVAAQPA